ncbi:hypothetical protein ANN_05329 [Periplaneta americana]|uniref:Uncharacterized protein n=1 Tax=Periplaneta americana TaxID=6978 RepID=A0ABQ8TAU8_PERAM|nr:hypothetical protein ANN_05329 [Periplaneta americana]
MVGLCEGGNEPPGSLKANKSRFPKFCVISHGHFYEDHSKRSIRTALPRCRSTLGSALKECILAEILRKAGDPGTVAERTPSRVSR